MCHLPLASFFSNQLWPSKTIVLKLIVLLILLAAPIQHLRASTLIVTNYQDTAPKFMINESGYATGVCVDIFKAIEHENASLQFSKPNHYVPIKRIFHYMEQGTTHIYCGAGYNAKRAKKFVYSTTALYPVSTVLVASKELEGKFSSLEDLRNNPDIRFMAIEGTSTYRLVNKLELPLTKHFIRTIDQALTLALRFNNELFAYHSLGINYALKDQNKWSQLKVLDVTLRDYEHWMIYSKHLPKSKRDAIDEALTKLKENGALTSILNTYR